MIQICTSVISPRHGLLGVPPINFLFFPFFTHDHPYYSTQSENMKIFLPLKSSDILAIADDFEFDYVKIV